MELKHSPRVRLVALVLFLAAFVSGCAAQSPKESIESFELTSPLPENIGRLRSTFRAKYDEAVVAHGQRMRTAGPIITQDLLNMTLLRADGPPVRFSMKSRPYMLMAHSSHPPLTVYSMLSIGGFGQLSEATKRLLQDYATTLNAAGRELTALGLPPSTESRLMSILSRTESFVLASVTRGSATKADFEAYAEPLRELIRGNFRVGASEQLVQFRSQLEVWRKEFPDENWADLKVVVMGVHQARDLYALKLLFQWLLREPGYEDRVVFAEFMTPPVGGALTEAQAQALVLLTKVDFEHSAGQAIFGDRSIMQRDVMGPAASGIIQQWGESDWPAPGKSPEAKTRAPAVVTQTE
jgi:hypothetical protein